MEQAPTRNTASSPEVTGLNTEYSTQALDRNVLAARGIGAPTPPASTSPLSHATCPAATKELQRAPLIDECIKRLQDEKRDSVKASPSFNTTEIRGLANNKIGFVSAMRLSTVQTLLARYVSMNDLAALANACSAIGGSLNLGDEHSRKMFEGLTKNNWKALESLRGPRTKRKLDGGETVYAPSLRPQLRERKKLRAFASVFIHD
ncbi:uncharacterized protein J4E92_006382 [Alternaria infectoria]|uniref:uncharacterized protein n=1 Tax=Alternaria infectoria TaxID=45303 RepID=UPI00221E8DE8|nr:uncharacterized protein J4E92_006382 [Alternaria infectoria]KAI4927215.1 hypothetical protein J4E92_006382 [Alternaria infectoria]